MAGAILPVLYKKMFLRVLFEACKKNLLSLSDALLSAAKSAVESSGKDVVLTGTSANGASVNYSLANESNAIPVLKRIELLEELLELYEALKEQYPTLSDEEIFKLMLAAYAPKGRNVVCDFGGLRK